MSLRFLIPWVLIGPSVLFASQEELLLLNGNRLTGRVLETRGPHLVFQPRWSQVSTDISLREVDSLVFAGERSHRDLSRAHQLLLVNGDLLAGRLVSLDEHAARWRTPWGAEWTLARAHVREIRFPPPSEDVFVSGTLPLDDWEITPLGRPDHEVFFLAEGDAITVRPRAMANLTRRLPRLPKRLVLEFTVRNDTENFSYNISLFNSPGAMRSPGSMVLQTNRRQLNMQVLGAERNRHTFWRENLPPGSEHERRYRLFVDWEANKARLDVNGAPVREFDLPADQKFAGTPRTLLFQFAHQGSHIRLEGLRLFAWKGDTDAWDASEAETRDVLVLWGAGPLQGRLLGMKDGRVRFQVADGEIQTHPLHELQAIMTRRDGRAVSRARPSDVMVGLGSGRDRLTFSGFSLATDTMTGSGNGWQGELSLPRAEARAAWFNIHHTPGTAVDPLSFDLEDSFLQLPAGGGGAP